MIIPGFDMYDIDKDGTVINIKTGREIKPVVTSSTNGNMYLRISLRSNNGTVRMYNVAKLVAEAYLSKPTPTAVVQAIDGNNLNVSLDNLRYITRAELSKQAWADGKLDNRKPKQKCWSENSVEYVYDTLATFGPMVLNELVDIMDLSYSTVRYSVDELRRQGKVRKTKCGLEVVL